MSFTPTADECRRFASYRVVVREGEVTRAHVTVQDGSVYRWTHEVNRYDDEKVFAVFVFPGATAAERADIERVANALPHGEWARYPDDWVRRTHRTSGRTFHRQVRGHRAPDPFVQLELEAILDAELAATR